MRRHVFNVHIVLWPAEDVPGQWLGHCLELDVISQGNSLPHALEMVKEAVGTVLVADLQKGLDPTRRRAPEEDWDAMWHRLRAALPRPLAEVVSGQPPSFVVIESTVGVTEMTPQEFAALAASATPPPPPAEFTAGVAFAPAAEHAA